ncbi:hypothetical protein [Roseomonas gilardii]|uniref:hypothetical protein n=1 Tax=Roseomonas gilardii TaxID=257708 RepID=UPI0011A74979|nr:hypothetical protein [Roseomonas gilardii]
MIKFITFFTQGKPHDEGFPLTLAMLNMKSLVEDQGYVFDAYCPERIRSLGAGALVKVYPEEYRLPKNQGLHKIGFAAWKPFIILDAMKSIGEEDVVFYLDCNLPKYPAYREKISNIRNLVELASNIGDFFVARERPDQALKARYHSSKTQMEGIGSGSQFCYNFPLLIVNNVIAKKSQVSQEILTEWLINCAQHDYITPPEKKQQDAEFKWFCPEQAILNQIIARRIEEGVLSANYPGISVGRGFSPIRADEGHLDLLEDSFTHTAIKPSPQNAPSLSSQTPIRGQQSCSRGEVYFNIAPSDWVTFDDATITLVDDNSFFLGDGNKERFHLIRATDKRFMNKRVNLRIVARPTEECSAGLHVHHLGHANVATVEKDGTISLLQNVITASCEKQKNGDLIAHFDFINKHEVLLIGLGKPSGFYAGLNKNHYLIKEVSFRGTDI